MKELKKEREVLVQAKFYVDKVDPNAPNIPDLLRDKFEAEVDRNNIFFSICIPGDNRKIDIEEIMENIKMGALVTLVVMMALGLFIALMISTASGLVN